MINYKYREFIGIYCQAIPQTCRENRRWIIFFFVYQNRTEKEERFPVLATESQMFHRLKYIITVSQLPNKTKCLKGFGKITGL